MVPITQIIVAGTFKFDTEPGVALSIVGPHQNVVIDLTQTYNAEFFDVFLCFFKWGLVDV